MFVAVSRSQRPASSLIRNSVVALACLALLGTKAGICQTPTPVDYAVKYKEVQRAILVFQQGKHDAAREILVDAASIHDQLPPVDVMMARLYLSASEIGKAESALEQVVVEHPDDAEGFLLLADLALRERRTVFAELAYERASLVLDQNGSQSERDDNLRIRVLAGLASLAESRGQHPRAVSLLASWIELEPDSLIAYGSLGRVSFHLQEYDQARAAFARLSELSSKSPPVEIAMGRLFSEAAMYDEAFQEMTSAAKQHSSDPRVLLTVAEWALNNGMPELAQRSVSDAIKLDQDSIEAQVLSARLARYQGDYETAESLLSKLMPLQPNSLLLADEFARTLAVSTDSQKRKAALQYAERNYRFLRSRKKNSSMMLQAIVTYAWTLLKNGEADKAEAVIRSLPNGSSISNENGYYVASIYAGREKANVAIAMLKSLLAENRPFPSRDEAESLLASLTNT